MQLNLSGLVALYKRNTFTFIYDHCNTTGHKVTIDNFSIVRGRSRTWLEPSKNQLNIKVNSPPMNKNIGKYHLPHIRDDILFKTSEFKWHNMCHSGYSICHSLA